MLKHMALVLIFLSNVVLAGNGKALDKIVAEVNNSVITESELMSQVNILRKQMEARHVPVPNDVALRKQVLQHLIDVDLQLQLAKQHGISIEATELNEALEKIAASNKLTLTELRKIINEQGMQWEAYRENIRKEMIINQLQQRSVGKNVAVTDEQVKSFMKTNANTVDHNQQTFHLQNIVIPLIDEPTADQVTKAKNKAMQILTRIKKGEDLTRVAEEFSNIEFAIESGDLGERHLAELPEIFAKEVINMKQGSVAGPLRTGNGFHLIKLVAVGGQEQNHIVSKTHVRHILIKVDASTTVTEAKRQVNNLYQQLQSGKDFAVMAKQYSADTGSAIKGGDLGWMTPGELVPPFEKAMDKLAINQISRPVKSQFGWHLIQVLARKKEDDTEAFKIQQARTFLQQRKFSEAVQSWQQHMRGTAYVNIVDKALA